MVKNLKNAKKILTNAACPEDVFGELDGKPEEALKKLYRQWARLTHSDSYRGTTDKALATECFKLLQKWRKVADEKIKYGKYGDHNAITKITLKTRTDAYIVDERLAPGDICEIYGGTNKAGDRIVLKVTRSPANNDLAANEGVQLRYLWNSAPMKAEPTMMHIVKLLDTFEITEPKIKIKRHINVFPRLDGYYTLRHVIEEYPEGLDARDAAWMMNRLFIALYTAHEGGIVHGAVLPTHIMICPNSPKAHNGVLIDWSYATKAGGTLRAISPAFKHFYPAEVLAKAPAKPSIDVYMAAMCFIELLGGTPKTQSIPDGTHRLIKGFIRSCLLSATNRPRDGWSAFSDFEEAIKKSFGKRIFRPFTMPRETTT